MEDAPTVRALELVMRQLFQGFPVLYVKIVEGSLLLSLPEYDDL